jgi:hypothetical protein
MYLQRLRAPPPRSILPDVLLHEPSLGRALIQRAFGHRSELAAREAAAIHWLFLWARLVQRHARWHDGHDLDGIGAQPVETRFHLSTSSRNCHRPYSGTTRPSCG